MPTPSMPRNTTPSNHPRPPCPPPRTSSLQLIIAMSHDQPPTETSRLPPHHPRNHAPHTLTSPDQTPPSNQKNTTITKRKPTLHIAHSLPHTKLSQSRSLRALPGTGVKNECSKYIEEMQEMVQMLKQWGGNCG